MVLSFEEPESEAVRNFWGIIASRECPYSSMSGGPNIFITGWVATFCFWTSKRERNLPGPFLYEG
ncbi:hypothetical protein QBC43DRAFT_324165 [Cladorrhinum sp. PSN259]|nr:hypothetical protein QBC43DRAFT_324165 [Cladorrhinum sp. PSN259]